MLYIYGTAVGQLAHSDRTESLYIALICTTMVWHMLVFLAATVPLVSHKKEKGSSIKC